MDRDLLFLARNSLRKTLGLDYKEVEIKEEWIKERATFVTITESGDLRGCIGSLEARQPLYVDIKTNINSAAFRDPRFYPLQAGEIDNISIEISILTPLKEITFKTEEDLLKQIVPFKMGLLLEHGLNRGTFLPQVWENFPTTEVFFNHLKQKAGLTSDFFSSDMKLFYYEVEKCKE